MRHAQTLPPLGQGDLPVVVSVTVVQEGHQAVLHDTQGPHGVLQLTPGHEPGGNKKLFVNI